VVGHRVGLAEVKGGDIYGAVGEQPLGHLGALGESPGQRLGGVRKPRSVI
jgi:hypothetical protein